MNYPSGLAFFYLSAAIFRTYRLIGEDTLLDRPRNWVLRLPMTWEEGDPVPRTYRENLAYFITCPFCAGFWLSVAWYGFWLVWPHATVIVAVVWALSGATAFIALLMNALSAASK